METTPKRPLSVLISQIVLVLYALLFLVALGVAILAFNVGTTEASFVAIALALVFLCGLVALFLVAFWGLMKRKKWARWMTIGLFVLMLLSSLANQVLKGIPGSGSSGYVTGYLFGSLLFMALFALLIWRLALGQPATNYFADSEPEAEPEA